MNNLEKYFEYFYKKKIFKNIYHSQIDFLILLLTFKIISNLFHIEYLNRLIH